MRRIHARSASAFGLMLLFALASACSSSGSATSNAKAPATAQSSAAVRVDSKLDSGTRVEIAPTLVAAPAQPVAVKSQPAKGASVKASSVPAALAIERVIDLGTRDSHVMEPLDHLANRIGPRLTGSRNFTIACEWAREQFEALGLQNVHLETWGEFPVGFNRGPASGRVLGAQPKELHFATNAWTAGTRGPTRGNAVLAPTNDAEME